MKTPNGKEKTTHYFVVYHVKSILAVKQSQERQTKNDAFSYSEQKGGHGRETACWVKVRYIWVGIPAPACSW